MDTLAVQLIVPLAGPVRDLNPKESVPCRAHQNGKGRLVWPAFVISEAGLFVNGNGRGGTRVSGGVVSFCREGMRARANSFRRPFRGEGRGG
jgi:hypothetical protein